MSSATLGSSIILFAVSFLASLFGVGLFTRWSRNRGLFDIPNERSSHSTPTPRGGGLIIVVICLTGYVVVGFVLDVSLSWGYLAGAVIVSLVSWLDDLYSLPFWTRFLFHLAAAGILILDLGFWSQISFPSYPEQIVLGNVVGIVATAVWLVWLLNAFNFMDGIDGIAALQTVLSCIAWGVLASFLNLPSTFLLSGIIASSSAGFLIHNWQPAKVFMGDVGSAFLGFTLGAIPLLARREMQGDSSVLIVGAVLFVWFFVFDTVFTFVRRLIARKRVWQAHREHIYQKLVIEGKAHSTVALIYASGSAFLSATVLLALIFSGIFWLFALFSLFALTLLAAYYGVRKKD